MFIENQDSSKVSQYYNLLSKIGSLSRLYSDSDTPYLYYRAAERVFCYSLDTQDHTRSDLAIDTSWKSIGIGLKTFTHSPSPRSFQKISEFNRLSSELRELLDDPHTLMQRLGSLYNKRIRTARRIHDLDQTLFHCVVRKPGSFLINEYPMDYIDSQNLSVLRTYTDSNTHRLKTIDFTDLKHTYKFNVSKSTLFREFHYSTSIIQIPITILDDPFHIFEEFKIEGYTFNKKDKYEIVYLPLYSKRSNFDIYVPQKSGLNQWNAGGRPRDPDELYIRIPARIHKIYPGFFPPRDQQFNLKLPNNKVISAKVCQQNSKALMSNPNKALGKWLLREVLEIPYGRIITYSDLSEIGIDTVEVRKINEEDFEIDFKELGTFEDFEQDYLS